MGGQPPFRVSTTSHSPFNGGGATTLSFGKEDMEKNSPLRILCALLLVTVATSCRTPQHSISTAKEAFGGLDGALVLIDCASGQVQSYNSGAAGMGLPPCSTFKIVNALIGLEEGLITSPDQPFYKWDGVERSIPAWNRDLSLREAFQASCVPAFQELAREVGPDRMQTWIDKIGYGNRNISAGIDVFWLPSKGRQTILISPMEQGWLIQRIVSGDVPFSRQSLDVLRQLMLIRDVEPGRLYGKTGSGTDAEGTFVLGWFVGYAESKGNTYAFACTAQGKNVMSRQARAIVERVLESEGILARQDAEQAESTVPVKAAPSASSTVR